MAESGRPSDYAATVGRGMQPTDVRQANQRAILTLISLFAGLSNADLARRTGLAPQTVSAVLGDLEQSRLIMRGEVVRGRRGQPATPLYLNPRGAFAIGAEIGWNHVRVTLVGLLGQVIAEYRRDYDYPDAASIFDELASAVIEVTTGLDHAERQRLIGLGLATPGGIGQPAGLIAPSAEQARLWAGLDIQAAVARATGLDVRSYNDGNAASWGEFVVHPTPRPSSFTYLLIDTLVAAGVIAESRLWEGASGASGSLGSMLVSDREGKPRLVDEIASLHALRRRLEARGLGLDHVLRAEDSPAAAELLDEWVSDAASALVQAVINTATVVEHEVAIVEAALPGALIARITQAMNDRIQRLGPANRPRPRVVAGHVGASGVAQGAARLRLYRRFFSRELQHMQD